MACAAGASGTGLTIIVRVTGSAHCPASGAKVYSVVAVLFITGDHEPVILFWDIIGRSGISSPAQNGPIPSNVGTMLLVISIVSVTSSAH